MKNHLIRRSPFAVALGVIAFLSSGGLAAFALPFLAFLNFAPASALLGMAYPNVNTTTAANLVADTAKARQELWVRSVLLEQTSGSLYQTAPLAEGGFMGRVRPGDKGNASALRKAIIEVTETSKVAGNTINIATRTGLGGPGVSGEGIRDGTEQKIHNGSYQLKIGRFFYAVGYTAIARDETFQGPMFDSWIRDELRRLHAKKKNDDHLMRLREAAGTTIGARNIIYPEGISSVATLKTANVLDTTLINNMSQYLPRIGGVAMDVTEDSGGSLGELFTLFTSDNALEPLGNEPNYVQAVQQAGMRGNENPQFKGGFVRWNGTGIYRWIHRDHANRGPIGSPLLPRAVLGRALTGTTTGSIIHGGGFVAGATQDTSNANNTNTGDTTDGPAPLWFEFFSNAPYTYYNGDTIAAVENVTRYLMIINNDGTGYKVYSYQVNNAKAIIVLAAISTGVGTETTTHPVGSLIVECNALSVPFGYSHMLGAQALVCGNGSINGSTANPQMGVVKEKDANYGMDLGIGVEGVWGNAAAKRAGDNSYPNFLLAKHAIPVYGAPVIQ